MYLTLLSRNERNKVCVCDFVCVFALYYCVKFVIIKFYLGQNIECNRISDSLIGDLLNAPSCIFLYLFLMISLVLKYCIFLFAYFRTYKFKLSVLVFFEN